MGGGVEAYQGAPEGDLAGSEGVPASHQASSGTRKTQEGLVEAAFLTVRRFLGGFRKLASGVSDPRDPDRIQYPLASLLGAGVFMLLLRLGSRRRFNQELRHHQEAEERFQRLFKVASVPHGDTLERTFARLDVGEAQEMVTGSFERMLRARLLESLRFRSCYVLALDMTGTLSFGGERHCVHCLTQESSSGERSYYHNVLEAKLVHENGLAISVMSEFVENPHPDPETQDSELPAFDRLTDRFKTRFPRLPVLLTLDGLYSCGRVFETCRKKSWKFIAVLRAGRIPGLNQEFERLVELEPGNRLTVQSSDRERRTYRWVNGLHHVDSEGRVHEVNVLDLVIEHPDGRGSHWRWVTNLTLKPSNVDAIATEVGRARWKIENEGFNVQKTGGYGLEHAYSANPIAAKVFYFLLQLAHLLHQMLERGSLLTAIYPERRPRGRRLARLLLEAWRNAKVWSHRRLEELEVLRFQIRFDTS